MNASDGQTENIMSSPTVSGDEDVKHGWLTKLAVVEVLCLTSHTCHTCDTCDIFTHPSVVARVRFSSLFVCLVFRTISQNRRS